MSRELRKNILKSVKRVVIKVGSGVISDHESGKNPLERGLSQKRIRSYAKRIKAIADAVVREAGPQGGADSFES